MISQILSRTVGSLSYRRSGIINVGIKRNIWRNEPPQFLLPLDSSSTSLRKGSPPASKEDFFLALVWFGVLWLDVVGLSCWTSGVDTWGIGSPALVLLGSDECTEVDIIRVWSDEQRRDERAERKVSSLIWLLEIVWCARIRETGEEREPMRAGPWWYAGLNSNWCVANGE